MAKSQKDAVVEMVKATLGSSFISGQTVALTVLTSAQLSRIKQNVAADIMSGVIAYSKSTTNQNEVKIYASSMVMNHLKKAKELNGGNRYVPTSSNSNTSSVVKVKTINLANKNGIDTSILPAYMQSVISSQ